MVLKDGCQLEIVLGIENNLNLKEPSPHMACMPLPTDEPVVQLYWLVLVGHASPLLSRYKTQNRCEMGQRENEL